MTEISNEQFAEPWVLVEAAFPHIEEQAILEQARLAGAVVLAEYAQVEFLPEEPNESTLFAVVQKASLGDEASERTLTTNIEIDVAERILKAGHQTKVALQVHGGALYQNGIALRDIYENTFRYTKLNTIMQRRSEHETKNLFVFEQLLAAGILETYDALVFSQATEDLTTQEDYNFFADTATCSVQLFRQTAEGAELQTALVAGKVHKDAARHDTQAIAALMAKNGAYMHITDVDDTIKTVVLVPKSTVAGVEAVVEAYDNVAGGTFYGQALPKKDYAAYAEACYQRTFASVVADIKRHMLAEAHLYTSPLEVVERLNYLSGRLSVAYSIENTEINAAVFGLQAAFYIEQARMFAQEGDTVHAEASLRAAQKTETSGSCPLYTRPDQLDDGSEKPEEKSKVKRMNCPDCDAVVYDDPCARVLKCWDCKAMVINGKKFEGNGGSRARLLQKQQQPPAEGALIKPQPEHVKSITREVVLQGT